MSVESILFIERHKTKPVNVGYRIEFSTFEIII